ncbi:MAG: GNAT family N-acetyltransferase [Myxococcales bacterium]|nr:GNAT family N-acetyltransferase [Myxococcales bacterium]
MILEAVGPFRSQDVAFELAVEPWELRGYARLRRRIFCEEQRLFEGTDRDEVDERAIPLVALSRVAGVPDEVVGVVRIWQEDTPGEWWGGRLGTHPDHRRNGTIGPGLIRLAVSTACRRGCRRFRATVQVRNVPLFERLCWAVTGEAVVSGQPHALMEADLSHYAGGLQ